MTQVANSLATVPYIYKRRYSDRQAAEIAMRDHAWLNAITKEEGLDGQDFAYSITTGNPQGIANDFPTAQANAETLKGNQLVAVPFTVYGDLIIDGPSLLRARGGKASFYDLVTRAQDGILDELGADIAFNLQRDATNVRGQRLSAAANVITLTNKRDVEHFKRGMVIIASTNANGSAPRAGVGCKIVGLNRASASITVDNAANITGFADNDFLFRMGQNGTGFEGMETCTPLTAPVGGDSFRGNDRSVDVEALAGSRVNSATGYPEEVFGDLAVEISIVGKKGKGWSAVCFPTVFQAMVKRLGAKVEYMDPAGDRADVGFEYITIHTAGGSMQIMPDPDARWDRLRIANPETHCIKCIDTMVHLIRDDGRPNLRTGTSDGLETRARFLGNYIQYDTASHGVANTAAT
jgi:hypothetical protein